MADQALVAALNEGGVPAHTVGSAFDPELIKTLIAREREQEDKQKRFAPAAQHEERPTAKQMSPRTALLLGQAADSASTLHFLTNTVDPSPAPGPVVSKSHHRMREANPALQYMNKSPMSVIPTAIAGSAAYALLHKLIAKKHPKIADAVAGVLGGYHMALGGSNMQGVHGGSYANAVDKLTLGKK